MEDIINHKGYCLIGKLKILKKGTPIDSKTSNLKGSEKEQAFVDLSSKLGREGICRLVTEYYGLTELNDIYYYDENSEIKFDKEGFIEFQSLVSQILVAQEIDKIASKEFIESSVYNWMIEVLKTRSDKKLLAYIKSELNINVKEYEFFYPIINLTIDEPFELGTIHFTYFTKQYMDGFSNYIKTGPNTMTVDQFNNIIRADYQGKVLAKVVVFAEKKKAEQLAKRQVELTVDILKIIVLGTHATNLVNTFELNYRLNFQTKSKYLLKEKTSPMGYMLGINFENKELYHLEKIHLKKCQENGLFRLAEFISLNNNNEFFKRLINAIEMYSIALSISDLHRRIIALVTIIESLLIEDDKEYGMGEKANARFRKVLPNKDADKQIIKATLSYIYNIRNSMVHKAIRLPIDYNELNRAQGCLIAVFHNLIHMNLDEGIQDKTELFKILDARLS